MKVLHVEDDPDFRTYVHAALETAGHGSESCPDGESGLDRLRASGPGAFDLVLLDLQMPGISGTAFLVQLREAGDEVPVVVVSGVDSTAEKVRCLKAGADDYLVKPVEFEELLARLEAVLRRRRTLEPLVHGDLHLDLAHRKVRRGAERVHLSPKEFDLLQRLVEAGGETVDRKTLLLDVWDLDFDPGTNLLDVHVGRLRKKLDRGGAPSIETVRGEGYRLLGPSSAG